MHPVGQYPVQPHSAVVAAVPAPPLLLALSYMLCSTTLSAVIEFLWIRHAASR